MPPFLVLVAAVLLAGCAGADRGPFAGSAAPPSGSDVAVDLFLIGDAGEPDPEGEPVLDALEGLLRERPERAFVVFLGDNIYPDGLPDEGEPRREDAERDLDAQLDVLRAAGVRGVFVPGNHDWDHSGPRGLDRIRDQGAFVRERADTLAAVLPADGCPGPAVVDVGDAVRVVAIDSQWFLHPHARPVGDACAPAATVPRFIGGVQSALAEAAALGRHAVVVAHHPIVSGGAHGVLPFVPRGVFYRPRFTPQDLGHPLYSDFRARMAVAFAPNPPLIYAAGHDHSLQVIRGGGGAQFALVSGAGIYGHTSSVRSERGMLYGARASGFMRATVYADGRVDLRVYEVDADGRARVAFEETIAEARPAAAPAADREPGGAE